MSQILNKTQKHKDRFTLITDGMGCVGDPEHYPTHTLSVATGVNRGNGYQGYMSVTYALTECEYIPQEARLNLIRALNKLGYAQYIVELIEKS